MEDHCVAHCLGLHVNAFKSTSNYSVVIINVNLAKLLCYITIDYIQRYATEEILRKQDNQGSSSEGEVSDLSEDETQDMEM